MIAPSFYAPVPAEVRAEDVLSAYLDHLRVRNGDLDTFAARDARMADRFDRIRARASVAIDPERFDRNHARLADRDLAPEELALLAFVKINAGEAYGVEVVGASRRALGARPDVAWRIERVLLREELYHTRILVGAVRHFDGIEPGGAWRPTWPLRLLIGGLARSPEATFHPILLGAEIAGVYAFQWLLGRLGDLFPDDPGVRESMEERLIEILIDEIGHIAFNRVKVGAAGRAAAARVARLVTEAHRISSPELRALGLDDDAIARVERFDWADLPAEVRERGFFA